MTDAPPKPSHAGSLLATAVLLTVWLGLTVGAPWLVGPIADVAESLEVSLGMDRLPGKPTRTPKKGSPSKGD